MIVRNRSMSRATLAVVLLALTLPGAFACNRSGEDAVTTREQEVAAPRLVSDLVLYPGGAVAFEDRPIAADTLEAALTAITPYASLAEWRLITIQEETHRIQLLESMQKAYRGMGRDSWAATMERWKTASVLLAFVLPKSLREFGGVPPDVVRSLAVVEMGMGVQGLSLVARTYGLETHWIASALLIDDVIEGALGVPEAYDLAIFGMLGFPTEEVPQEYPALDAIVFKETWRNQP